MNGKAPPLRSGACGPRSALCGPPAGAGGSSSTTCALVPETPKDDTPARRGRSPADHSTGSRSHSTEPADQSPCGLGSSACSVGGSTPWRSASTILITPPTPAAAELWPMFDLSEPRYSGPFERSYTYGASSACASIGSPSVVPVPWPSTASTSAGDSPALASAARITRSCEGPFGAVSPFEAPSWFTAEPRTTASSSCPFSRARDRGSSTSNPAPSDQPVPSAPAPNALHRPSGDSPRWRENSMKRFGVAMTVAPPASASSHSPRRSAWHARCNATSDDERAVSTDTAGPSRPNVYASRPDATLDALPVRRRPSTSCDPLAPLP